jgi:hypothetical protein
VVRWLRWVTQVSEVSEVAEVAEVEMGWKEAVDYILYFRVNITLRVVNSHFLHVCGVNLPDAVCFTPGLYRSDS